MNNKKKTFYQIHPDYPSKAHLLLRSKIKKLLLRNPNNKLNIRNIEIFFDYYSPNYKNLQKIAMKYNLSRERIRQIVKKNNRILRNAKKIHELESFLKKTWKKYIINSIIEHNGIVTKKLLEKKFFRSLPLIYNLQNEILAIEDIWAYILEKNNNEDYSAQFLYLQKIQKAITDELLRIESQTNEWGMEKKKLIEIIDKITSLPEPYENSKGIIESVIDNCKKYEIVNGICQLKLRNIKIAEQKINIEKSVDEIEGQRLTRSLKPFLPKQILIQRPRPRFYK